MKTRLLAPALLFLASTASAQATPAVATAPSRSCLASIPPEMLKRVVVSAALTMTDSKRYEVPPVAANLLQLLVDRVTVASGATPGVIPQGEPGIPWVSVGRGLLITWHRDGKLAWRLEDEPDPVEPHGAKTAMLIAKALDDAQAAGETFMAWPREFREDSVEMRIGFVRPEIDEKGKVHPIEDKVAVPMFTVASPREKRVRVRKWPPQHYPQRLHELGIEGDVMMRFVVDTMGHADVLTIHDVSSLRSWETSAAFLDFHREFVATAREMIMQARYTPQETGGCKVRQVVQQPFGWRMR
jgi:hypothetical protein